VIFLDHMMLGMDGFETLTVLKRDPSTTTIPVVMYTSREGDAYMGQARARGAAGVLHKPINPLELSDILTRLRLMPDQVATLRAPARVVAQITGARSEARTARPVPRREDVTPAAAGIAPSRPAPPMPAASPAPALGAWAPPGFAVRWRWPLLYAVVLALTGAWIVRQYHEAEQLRAELAAQRALLNDQQRAADVTGVRLQLVQAAVESQRRVPPPVDGWREALLWAVNQHGQYEHDQIALNDERLLMVRELLTRLGHLGFRGTVRLETHVGEFCLVRDEHGAYHLPPAHTSMPQCEIVRYTPEQAQSLTRRQTPAFTRFLAERSAAGQPIQLALVAHGKSRPLLPYPDADSVPGADEWNQVARLNQRVEISLEPTP
jgi:CheY-like chemotaxis protein